MSGGPGVGVVIPAYREVEALDRVLRSLAAVEHDGPLHVVVAVDGAHAATVAVAERHGVTVLPLAQNRGSYAARNAALDALPDGLAAVLFTDADCVVSPQWVREHLRALEDAELSGGGVTFTFAGSRPTPAEWVDACRHLKQQVYVERDGFAATCNLAVRASVLSQHRFDDTLRTGGDAEFCRRSGARLVYTPDALIEHPARSLGELRTKVSRLASGVPGQAVRWRGRPLPPRRLTRGIWRRAQAQGHDVGPVWGVTACLIDWFFSQQVRRAVLRLGPPGSTDGARVTYVLTKYVQPTQTFVTGEIAELRRQGVEVDIIAVEHGDVAPEPTDEVAFLVDQHPSYSSLGREHLACLLHRPLGYLAFLLDVVRMRREMGRLPEQVPWLLLPGVSRRLRGSALHAHFAWSGAAAALLLSDLSGLPWSMTVHANDIFNRQRNLQRKLRAADRVVTVCDYNLRWMRENLGLTRDVDLVVCGVELPVDPWPVLVGADVVVVGRLVEKKGIDVLVRAAAKLVSSYPDLQVHVIGEGRARPQLEELVGSLGLASTVHLLGARSHEESLARIAGAQVFCLPARVAADGDRDSMPVVIKEAMARRVPVVASDVAAVAEMLDGGCGVLVPADDPDALAVALAAVLADPAEAAGMTERARSRVAERFTLSGETAKLRTLLLECP